jgi:hypothetical protein
MFLYFGCIATLVSVVHAANGVWHFTSNPSVNYCIGDFLAIFSIIVVNDRQCSFAVSQNAPQAGAFTYYMGNGTCYAHGDITNVYLAAIGMADPTQSTCIFYVPSVSNIYIHNSNGQRLCMYIHMYICT